MKKKLATLTLFLFSTASLFTAKLTNQEGGHGKSISEGVKGKKFEEGSHGKYFVEGGHSKLSEGGKG